MAEQYGAQRTAKQVGARKLKKFWKKVDKFNTKNQNLEKTDKEKIKLHKTLDHSCQKLIVNALALLICFFLEAFAPSQGKQIPQKVNTVIYQLSILYTTSSRCLATVQQL